MKSLNKVALMLWKVVGWPLTVVGVATALTLVISILGIVTMFIAVIVPFGMAVPLLVWLSRRR